MGILKGLQVTVMHPFEKPMKKKKKAYTFPYMDKNERLKLLVKHKSLSPQNRELDLTRPRYHVHFTLLN